MRLNFFKGRSVVNGRGTDIKQKTARRFLNKNAFKLARLRVDKVKKHKLLTQEDIALKILEAK